MKCVDQYHLRAAGGRRLVEQVHAHTAERVASLPRALLPPALCVPYLPPTHMRRPWELAHMQGSRAPAGTRVYVPFTLPDTTDSTFAVLELVGFCSSPAPSQSSISPSLPPSLLAQPVPTQICHSQLLSPFSFSAALNSGMIPLTDSSVTNLTESCTTCVRRVASASNPHCIQSTQSVDGAPFSSHPVVATKPAVVSVHIKESVVHTTSLNFKDIVQQLTGATSNNKTAMTPTEKLASDAMLPTPSTKKTPDSLSVKVNSSKGFKMTPSKLQQIRRKSVCNLERLSTQNGFGLPISPLSPSPVTPLTSYLNKSYTAVTPTASQSSGHGSGISSSEASQPESNSASTSFSVRSHPAKVAAPCSTGNGRAAHALTNLAQATPVREPFHGPAILSLFPEFPR